MKDILCSHIATAQRKNKISQKSDYTANQMTKWNSCIEPVNQQCFKVKALVQNYIISEEFNST